MEVILVLFGLAVLFAPFILSIVALARTGGIARLEEQLKSLREEVGDLRAQIARTTDEPRRAPTPLAEARTPAPSPEEPPAAASAPETPAVVVTPLRAPAPVSLRVAEPAPAPMPTIQTIPTPSEPVATATPVEQPTSAAATPLEPTTVPQERPATDGRPTLVPVAEESLPAEPEAPPKKSFNLEEALGRQVFLWTGVMAVTVGVAFFLYLAAQEMGALGKVAIGFGGGAALLGVGFFAERRERYKVFGRPLLAGGCAIIYFVAFAMHFIPAARLIDSEIAAVLLLFAAGALGVGLSLRYRHEWTTTFSFLLIFLTLGVAAAKTDATFNLASTAIVAAGLAFLVWRLAWDRLLALGAAATWITLSLWLLPNTWDLPAMEVVDVGKLFALLGPIAGTWAAFQLAMLLRRREHEIRETWHVLGYLVNMLGGFGLLIHLTHTLVPKAAFVVAALFGVLYIGCAWLFQRRGRRVLYLMSATIGLLALGLVSMLRLGFGSYWVPSLRLIGIELVIFAGVLLKERYFRTLGYLAFLWTVIEVLFLKSDPVLVTLFGLAFHHRIILLAGTSLFGFLNIFLTRRTWRQALSEGEVPFIFYFFSAAASVTLLVLTWMEIQDPWVAPTLGGLSLLGVVIANRLALEDLAVEATSFGAAALIAILAYDLDLAPTPTGMPVRPVALGLVALALVLSYVLYRFRVFTADDEAYASIRKPAAVVTSVTACLVIGLLVVEDVPPTWVAPTLAALTATLVALALGLALAELLYEALAFTLATVCAIAYFSWPLTHHVLGLPARPVSVGLVIVVFYVTHQLFERFLKRRPDTAPPALKLGGWSSFATVTSGYLALTTLVFVGLVKVEALTYDKNLLVALVVGVLGVAYIEVARLKVSRAWHWHGHLLVLAATVHLFLVNFVQEGAVGPLSLRLLTVVPFFFFLLYVYATFDETTKPLELTERARATRFVYFYAMIAVAAVLMMYELPRAWVIVGWTALGVGLLMRWQRTQDAHWRLCALILGVAALARSFAVNLYYRDESADFRLNLVTIPLTCLGLLLGYVIIRRAELKAASALETGGRDVLNAARRPRTVWFVALVALLTGFIWVEAEGTILTVWLSIEGLALVALGFLAKERLSRLTGLLMLSFCILKLFIYDLRDLTGLSRIASFIVLGLVLIAVSFAYTRFKERLQEIL